MNSRIVILCVSLQVLLRVSLNEALPEKKEVLYRNCQKAIDQSNFEIPWFSEVPSLPILFASSSSLPDGPCKKQTLRYLNGLRNGTLWASRMYDASTKFPDGILSGYTRHQGDFDGCYNLKASLLDYEDNYENRIEEVSGRYCLVDIEYTKLNLPPVRNDERHDLTFDSNESVWEAIREKGDLRRVKRYILQLALCVPEVCNFADVEKALQEPLTKFGLSKEISINVSVKSHNCQSLKDSPKFSLPAKIYCWIVVSLIVLVMVSTWFDIVNKEYNESEGSIWKDLILCFSARRNLNTILEPVSGNSGLKTIHLLRYIYLSLAMLVHRTFQYFGNPVINVFYMEWLYTFSSSVIFLCGSLIIDGFFSFGGLLLSYNLLIELDLKKKMNFSDPIIKRFFRFTPSYMLVVFFNALLLHHFGNGPYWESKVGHERDNCLNNWWTNLFYINTYVNPKNMCMFQSWYVAVDFHLCIIASIVTYIFWRLPRKFGYVFLCLIILGGCVIPFVNSYVHNVPPLLQLLLNMQDIRDVPYFTDHYIKTEERISSYFIGVLAGAILYDHSRKLWRLNKVLSHILFILCVVVLSIGSLLYGYKFYDPNVKPTPLESAMYAVLQRCAFAIFSCSIPVLITVGDGLNFYYKFLTPRWVQPLARLTYGAYLIHTVHQLYDVGVTRIARTFSFHALAWDYIPDVVFTFTLSLLLALIVEEPFRRIEKTLICKRNSIPIQQKMD